MKWVHNFMLKENNQVKTFLLVAGGWLLFLLIDILKKNLLARDSELLLFYVLPGIVIWIALTFPIMFIFRKSRKLGIASRVGSLLVIGVVASIVKTVASWSIFYLGIESPGAYGDFLANIITFYYVESSIIAWILMIVLFVVELYGRYRDKSVEAAQLETKLSQAELQNLKMQLQPHFLFNAHNTVAMLIRTGRYDQAVTMISELSDMLRSSLTDDRPQFVALKEELEFMDKYLAIEQLRFEDTLQVKKEVADSLLNLAVPNLVLQPIIENAFKHGISKKMGTSTLRITANKSNGTLTLAVENSGPALTDVYPEGIGLRNTQERLKQLYGDKSSVILKNIEDGVAAEITIPAQIFNTTTDGNSNS